MENITREEIEMIARLVARAAMNYAEIEWANGVINKLRIAVQPKPKVEPLDKKPE